MPQVKKGSLGTRSTKTASPPNTVSGGDKGAKGSSRFNKHATSKRG